MADIISFIPENDAAFRRGLERLNRSMSDFRIPFRLISNDFFQSNRKLFTLRSKGLYQDLAPAQGQADAGGITTLSNYRARKLRQVGFIYPILRKTTRLEDSLTNPSGPEAVNVIQKQLLEMGTDTPYAIFHQSDAPRFKIPQRKVVFIDGGPAEKSQDAAIAGRRERWLNIINDHVLQVITGRVA